MQASASKLSFSLVHHLNLDLCLSPLLTITMNFGQENPVQLMVSEKELVNQPELG